MTKMVEDFKKSFVDGFITISDTENGELQTFNMSMPILSNTSPEAAGFGGLDLMKSLAISEITQSIYKKVSTEIFKKIPMRFCDVRGNGVLLDDEKSREAIIYYLRTLDYKNIICSSIVAMPIQDDFSFSSVSSVGNAKGLPYSVGKLRDMKVWVDPYMRFNDNTILFYDKCEMNFTKFEINIVKNDNRADSMDSIVEYYMDISNPGKGFVLCDMTNNGLNEYKRITRDQTLTDLLGEE